MALNLSKIPKFLDSDYVPIPHTDPNWLPKSIRNEYKVSPLMLGKLLV